MTESKSYALPKGTTLRGKKGNYKILYQLGEGGAGITYLAEEESTGGKVAVKEFFMKDRSGRRGVTVTNSSTDGNFEKYKAKHIKEAHKLMGLGGKHNIVRVTDLFEANNTAYYVMEYIEGGNLNDYIKRKGKLTVNEANGFIRQIADSVAYMHSQKMLHLDIKPKNVMMRSNGTLVLIDFGLSKVYDDNGEPESTTSISGHTKGFSPNEQSSYHDGKGFPVTMDVYALGATLFNMVVGVRPPSASDVMNLHNDFLEELKNAKVPENLLACIDKAMASFVKDRYQTVEEFVHALPKLKQPQKYIGTADDVTIIDTGTDIHSVINDADSLKIRFKDSTFAYTFTISPTKASLTAINSGVKSTASEILGSDVFSDFKRNIVPQLQFVETEKSNKRGKNQLLLYNKNHKVLATFSSTLTGEEIYDIMNKNYHTFGRLWLESSNKVLDKLDNIENSEDDDNENNDNDEVSIFTQIGIIILMLLPFVLIVIPFYVLYTNKNLSNLYWAVPCILAGFRLMFYLYNND